MRNLIFSFIAILPATAIAAGLDVTKADSDDDPPPEKTAPKIYATFGVHNPPSYSPCNEFDCLERRPEGAPSDPLFPPQWISDWVMYTVHDGYQNSPPPYPMEIESVGITDYTKSHGTTYYDGTFSHPLHSGEGAMMEFYKERCLPIFPIENDFTCAFVSLGNTAYFLTPDESSRPEGMPACCLFSPLNHPPRRDFIKHLPYNSADSARLPNVQAYSLRTPGSGILFGYAFNTTYTKDDAENRTEDEAYRHPNQFYFSGYPGKPARAPIVTQIYTNFQSVPPNATETWDMVGQMCTAQPLPKCALFNPENPDE